MRMLAGLTFVAAIVAFFPVAALAAGAAAAGAAARITVQTDKADAIYAKGETVTFLIELLPGQTAPPQGAAQQAECELSTDAFRHSEKSRITFIDGKARVSATRDFPCVLWIRVTYKDADGKPVQTLAGAAFSPLEITPSMPPPPDFDSFWADQKARLDKIPAGPKLEPMASGDPNVELFSLTLDNINNTKVYGQLAKPKGDGPFPAYLVEQWSGVYSLEPRWVVARAQQGFIALNINAHSIENGKPAEYYRELQQGALRDYAHQGRDNRETCYLLRMFLSCYRAAEYLASRPDWDRKHLIVYGDSQGGGEAIVTAALSPHVTAVIAAVPAMCDHTAMVVGRDASWPRLVDVRDGKPDPVQLEVARYFDVVNFARQAKASVIVTTGFADLTCPSSSIYAAYNVLPGPKQLVLDPLGGHSGGSPNWSKASADFLTAHSKD